MDPVNLEKGNPSEIISVLSTSRIDPYLVEAEDDEGTALKLYVWAAQMSSAAFELIAHLEVALRNVIDHRLREHVREQRNGIPWFFCSPPVNAEMREAIDATRSRLIGQNKDARDQIIANLSFGFWSGMLGTKHEELWRQSLRLAFPHSDGKRKTVSIAVEGVRKFRNRVAHHDSILKVDIPFETGRIFTVAGYIDPDFEQWLRAIDRTGELYKQRPITTIDTVVVPAREAWPLYRNVNAYVCQPGRSFNPVQRIAFYADKEIKREIPIITYRRDNVAWGRQEAERLSNSTDRWDRKISQVILDSIEHGWTSGSYQVFLLSAPGSPPQSGHKTLEREIPHHSRGRGSAFVRKQRYVSLHSLQNATTTQDLGLR